MILIRLFLSKWWAISGQEPCHLPLLSPGLEPGMNAVEWMKDSFPSLSVEAEKAWPFPLQHEPPMELAKSVFLQVLLFPALKTNDNVWLPRVTSPSFSTERPVSWDPCHSQASWDVGHSAATSFFSHFFLIFIWQSWTWSWLYISRPTILGKGWRGRGGLKKEASLALEFSQRSLLFYFCNECGSGLPPRPWF